LLGPAHIVVRGPDEYLDGLTEAIKRVKRFYADTHLSERLLQLTQRREVRSQVRHGANH
jgi:hypothetical protein